MRVHFVPVLLIALLADPQSALAAATSWFKTEGGDIRLLLSGLPEADGKLRGALEIRLKPGWKTYWRDPGGAGVPLQMDVSRSANVSGVEIGYPAPRRFDDGYSAYAGYDYPVSFALTFTVPDASSPTAIDADVFLGICETVCIPVQTTFQLTAAEERGSTVETAVVAAAHSGLPQSAMAGFQILQLELSGDELVVTAETPHRGDADLFVVNSSGWYFGTPVAEAPSGEAVTFRIPVLERPVEAGGGQQYLDYTLIVGQDSVEGIATLP